MELSIEELIKRQRNQANLSFVSQELKSDALKEKQVAIQHTAYWNEELKSCGLGYNLTLDYLQEEPTIFIDPILTGNEEDERVITLDECLISESNLEIFNDQEKMKSVFASSSLQKEWRKSWKVLLAYYLVAQKFFELKRFTDSLHIFIFLTFLNQSIPSFWIGRASAQESMENWDKALADYWVAQSIDQENILAFQGLLRIYNKLKDEASLAHCFKIIEKYPNLKNQLRGRISE